MKTLAPLAMLISLGACSTMAKDADAQANAAEAPTAAEGGECKNEGLDRFAGQQRNPELGQEMLRVSGAKTIQWIEADTMVTMEFRSDRLRVQLDPAGKVQSARCG